MGSKRTRIYGAIAALFFPCLLLGADLEPVTVRDFSPGLVTSNDPAIIPNGASPDMLNVDVEDLSVQKRDGSVDVSSSAIGGQSSEPVRFVYEYVTTAGERWIITAVGSTLYKSNNGGQDNTVLTSTHGFTSDSQYSAVSAFGTMRLTDGTTNWITFDGEAVGVSTSAPKGTESAFFADRVWTANVAGNASTLFGTNTDDVEDWEVNSSSPTTDAVEIPIRYNDGSGITCLKPFRDRLLVYKRKSIDAVVLQEDGLSYNVIPVSNEIGTSYCKSVVERENDIVFLGYDGFYKYDPAGGQYRSYAGGLTKLSDAIDPDVQSILQADADSISHIENDQSDFAAGTLTNVSISSVPGSIVLSTAIVFSQNDNSAAEFALGSLTNATTWFVPGFVYFAPVLNAGFEDNAAAAEYGWKGRLLFNGSTTTFTGYSGDAQSGTYSAEIGDNNDPIAPCSNERVGTYYFVVFSTGYSVLEQSSLYSTSDSGWVQKSFNLSAYAGQYIKIGFKANSPVNLDRDIFSEHPFYVSSGTLTWYDKTYTTSGGSCETNHYLIDNIGGSAVYSSGTFVSKSFDTGIGSPAWTATEYNATASGNRVTAFTQTSTDGLAWGSSDTWTSGSAPTSDFNQHIRYQINFSTEVGGYYVSWLSQAVLSARVSTGTYQGAHFTTDGLTFGRFLEDHILNDGGLAFAIYTDSDTVANFWDSSSWISSQTLTANVAPSLATDNYAFFTSSFSITASTQNPILNELSIALTGGSQVPVWASYHKGSYIVSVSTADTSANDTLFLYDRNSAWTRYDNRVYSMTRLLSGALLTGHPSNGKLIQIRKPGELNDSGAPINAYWKSKDFDFGYPLTEKVVLRYYLTADRESGSSLTFAYGKDRGAVTSQSLDLGSVAGFFRAVIKPSSANYSKGIVHSIRVSNSEEDDTFVLRSLTIKARTETDP